MSSRLLWRSGESEREKPGGKRTELVAYRRLRTSGPVRQLHAVAQRSECECTIDIVDADGGLEEVNGFYVGNGEGHSSEETGRDKSDQKPRCCRPNDAHGGRRRRDDPRG